MSVPVPKQRPSLVFALLWSVSKRQSCTHWLQVHVWQNVFISVLTGFHIWCDGKQHFALSTWCFPFPSTPTAKGAHLGRNCSYLYTLCYIQYNNYLSFLSTVSILCVFLFCLLFAPVFSNNGSKWSSRACPYWPQHPLEGLEILSFVCAQLKEDSPLHLRMLMDMNTAAVHLAVFWNEETLKNTIWDNCIFVETFKPYLNSVLIRIPKTPKPPSALHQQNLVHFVSLAWEDIPSINDRII